MSGFKCLLVLSLIVLLSACARSMVVRPLNCAVVECRGIRCETPPMGMPYMSDQWRCAGSVRAW